MFSLKNSRFASFIVAVAMIVTLALPAVTFADQPRKRGRHRDKKAEKFINRHDARDGRWDGRDPRWRGRRERWDDDWRDDRRPRRKRRR